MVQIHPHALWIGASGNLRDVKRLYELGINAVIHVAYEELPPPLPHDFILCRFPLVDGDGNEPVHLRLAIDTLTQMLERKFTCVICCLAGLSRSPAIAAAALAKLSGQSIDDSLAHIAQQHPCLVHPRLLAQVKAATSSK